MTDEGQVESAGNFLERQHLSQSLQAEWKTLARVVADGVSC